MKGANKMNEIKTILQGYFSGNDLDVLSKCISCEIPVIITGLQGPTGKTSLCKELRKMGYRVAEEWELTELGMAFQSAYKRKDDNTFCITITLNKPIDVKGAKK